jgi:DNA-binding CsgD family transcriptional regulator/tetratricopeptide (TPR) repeat protein
VIIVEDLHWADPATIDFFRFAARAPWEAQVLIAATYRSDEVSRGHPLRRALPELERGENVERIHLDRLTAAEVREQARSILATMPDTESSRALFERSEGVPFFVEELLNFTGTGAFPASLRDLLLSKYDDLDGQTREVVRLLAAGGQSVAHDLAASVVDNPSELDANVRNAIEAGLLSVVDDEYAFRHALVREAVLGELLPGERATFHSTFALALEHQQQTRDQARLAARIAAHWFEARNDERAFSSAILAMEKSLDLFGYATAAGLGSRALELWDRVAEPEKSSGSTRAALLFDVATAWYFAGEMGRAHRFVDVAIDRTPRTERKRYAELLTRKAAIRNYAGHDGVAELYEEALATLGDADPELRISILAELAAQHMLAGRLSDCVERASEAIESAPEAARQFVAIAANVRACARIDLLDISGGREDLELSHRLAGEDPQALIRYYLNASEANTLLGDYSTALEVAREGLRMALAYGVERSTGAMLAVNTIDPLFALGLWDEADALIDRSLELDPPLAFRIFLVRARLRSLLWRGEPDRAWEQYGQWRGAVESFAARIAQTRLGIASDLTDIAFARGDLDGAWEAASIIFSEPSPAPGYKLPIAAAAARVIAARRRAHGAAEDRILDDDEQALREAVSRGEGWPTHSLWLAVIDAELSGPHGMGGDTKAWDRVATHPSLPGAPAVTRLQASLGRARAAVLSGERDDAAQRLLTLKTEADRMGAGLISRWAQELITDAGLAERSGTASSGDLTSREAQVLELLAQGLKNSEIASALFISPKTVSVHVSSILRKLGADSRTEAAHLYRTSAIDQDAFG